MNPILPRAALPLVLLSAGLLAIAGCGPSINSRDVVRQKNETEQDEGVSFAQAIDLLENSDQYGAALTQQRALVYLGQWVSLQPEFDWKREPMLDGLPPDLKPWAEEARLDATTFEASDMAYLTEMIWLRNVTRWAADKPPAPADMRAWLAEVKKEQGDEVAAELAVAERLFDWTVRNIQLEKLPPAAAAATVGPLGPDLPGKKSTGPAKAVLLPGARYFPGEAIIVGQGDALVRARVFIHLLRQKRIEAVLLTLTSKTESNRPWAVGVLIGGGLYLFDPAVGLPVLGPNRRGIATWKQVQADPSLLRQMDLGGEDKYPVAASDLGGTIAWIDADPVALTKRMQMVEAKLIGQQRTILTTNPSRLAATIRKLPGIIDVRLWATPLHAYVYKRRLERDPLARQEAEMDARIYGIYPHIVTRYEEFDPRQLFEQHGAENQLYQGRVRHLAGELQGSETGERMGAKQLYLACRRVQGLVDILDAGQLEQVPEARMMLDRDPHYFDDPKKKAAYIAQLKKFLLSLRLRATYWMGMSAFDAGQFDVAAKHFQTRLLDELESHTFTAGTRYNLARSYEQLGNYDQARDALFQDSSEQKYGSELRARILPEK